MRTRALLQAALGAAAGLALVLGVGPSATAAARPSAPVSLSVPNTCSTFEGLTVKQQSITFNGTNGVALKKGETITANVSPLSQYQIIMTVSSSTASAVTWYSAPVTAGISYTAPVDATYHFGWSLESGGQNTSLLTWTFDCSTATSGGGTVTPTDSDRDGVADTADKCASTVLPDSYSRTAAGSYYANRSGLFIDGTGRSSGITVVDTGGCSATQIAKSLRLNKNASKSGISLSTLQSWAATH